MNAPQLSKVLSRINLTEYSCFKATHIDPQTTHQMENQQRFVDIFEELIGTSFDDCFNGQQHTQLFAGTAQMFEALSPDNDLTLQQLDAGVPLLTGEVKLDLLVLMSDLSQEYGSAVYSFLMDTFKDYKINSDGVAIFQTA